MPEKAKNLRAALGKLARDSRRYTLALTLALIGTSIATLLTALAPGYFQQLTDLLLAGLKADLDWAQINRVFFILVLIYVTSLIFDQIEGYVVTEISQRIGRNLRQRISGKINRLPFKYFNQTTTGDIISRVANDVDTISSTLAESLGSLFYSIVMFTAVLFLMFYTSWLLALVALSSVLVGMFLTALIMNKSRRYFVAQQKLLGDLNGHIEEVFTNHQVVKVYNGFPKATETFENLNGQLFQAAWRAGWISSLMQPMMRFMGNLGYLTVAVTGGILVYEQQITFGVVVAFTLYLRQLSLALQEFAQPAASLQRTGAATERIFEFLEADEILPDGVLPEGGKTELQVLSQVRGAVEFRNVQFGYEPDKPVIRDFSAYAHVGQKVAIVGPTGAGKTTLVNLLMRFYELDGGQILIDGVDITRVSRENLHQQFCMVLQDTWLFTGSVYENVAYARPEATIEEVIAACKAVGIHKFVKALPNRYDTVLDENTQLSVGQRQLLTIARAMVQDAPILILDEATSSVDTRTELIVQKAMDRLMEGRTSFVIAHRLSTIRNADLILVMKDGDILESGNHSMLLEKNGFYADLYNSQFAS
ncbi:ABC transporter ATP-binding protein/permease [Gleimia sp. 6138-11-ORH1]|uniref:ABC transporter ATP-binding protein n=1 Tax=Gleimia sp. 6138-11-ORH1 TaxID=2973937 RepID=UPI00216924AF|nr:ABC transporter ATP-binding protein [Gleimia sp. 6138-11-ORH1]MCS4484848.1 ABC transporter ATP-binding protein/permease [Gleimia sp. 6138-11-ORH1]